MKARALNVANAVGVFVSIQDREHVHAHQSLGFTFRTARDHRILNAHMANRESFRRDYVLTYLRVRERAERGR